MSMKDGDIKLAKVLTYSGTIPLLACVGLIFSPIAGVDNRLAATTYAAIIASFLCGIHWAIFLFFSEKCAYNLLITSNVLALLAWSSLLISFQEIAFIIQALCFLILLLLDFQLRNTGVLPEWFYHLRRNATIIVVSSLIAMAVLS